MSENIAMTEFSTTGSSLIVTILEKRMRDAGPVQQIKDEILSAITAHSPRNVIVNLQQVEYVGSVAFLAFLAIRRQGSIERIVLCNLADNVREVFQLCKLIPDGTRPGAPFEVAESLAAATASLG